MNIIVPTAPNTNPKVTFAFVNCNRLHYLKSCVESLLFCTYDYENKEIIIVDNGSQEEGTNEYLNEKELQGFSVFRNVERDPSNEYAKALNLIVRESTGDIVCPLTGDVQFIVKGGWLNEYVNFFKEHSHHIGCISLDAQRGVRLIEHEPYRTFSEKEFHKDFRFFIDLKRRPVAGNGLAFYSRELLNKIYPWSEENTSHEGGDDSENKMWKKVENLISSKQIPAKFHIIPQIPIAVSICTDRRGSSARVRGNTRFGEYWPPLSDFRYYNIHDYEDIITRKDDNPNKPLSIEMVTEAVGWDLPIDESGRWKKSSISLHDCSPDQIVTFGDEETTCDDINTQIEEEDEYVDDWLNS